MTEQERQQWTQYLKLQNMDPGCQSCENYYDDGEPEGGYMYPIVLRIPNTKVGSTTRLRQCSRASSSGFGTRLLRISFRKTRQAISIST